MPEGTSPPPSPPTTTSKTTTVVLGKYQLSRLLGRGSFAKVYQAHSFADNTQVAIKIIDKTKPLSSIMEPQILREVSAMKKLQPHPNILKIKEVMATKSKIYLVMELASGGELFSKIVRRGKFPESMARHYFQQLISALHFCHQNGVVHRDIKPQNLLLDHMGVLKLSDFGLSALTLPDQLKNGLLHTACGTPSFTAPEVVTRRGYDGSKADAWSCGVILFMLLTGSVPFDDSNIANMYKKVNRRDYHLPSWLSKSARYLINQLLDPNPNTRMSIEGVMNTSWFKKSTSDFKPSSRVVGMSCEHDRVQEFGINSGVNAFNIISMSSGLDLSGLFETETIRKKEKRFTSSASLETIRERVRDIGRRLGYALERGKGGCVVLRKGRSVLMVEVIEITQLLVLVEFKVVNGGLDLDDDVQWEDWKVGLADMVLSWHNDGS